MLKKILLLFVISFISSNALASIKVVLAPSTEYIAFYKKDINRYLKIRRKGFRTNIELYYPQVAMDIKRQKHFIEKRINRNEKFIYKNNSREMICRISLNESRRPNSIDVRRVAELADNRMKPCIDVEKYLKGMAKQHSEFKYPDSARRANISGYDYFFIID